MRFRFQQEVKLVSVLHLHLVCRMDYLSEIDSKSATKMDLDAITFSKVKEGSVLLMLVAIVVENERQMIDRYVYL